MAEASRFEATWRARLHDATILGANGVDGAWKKSWLGYVERPAAVSRILHETPTRRRVIFIRVDCKHFFSHTRVVALEEMHGARQVMTAATARDAIAAGRIRNAFDPRQHHTAIGHFRLESCGEIFFSATRKSFTVARSCGERRSVECKISARDDRPTRDASSATGPGKP